VRREGLTALCPACRRCPVVRACGGGLYAHRYREGSGFNNPSVYCEDLKILVPQVTSAPVPAPTAQPSGARARHWMPAEAFDLLAAGPGDPAAMTMLLDARWSVTRALVATVASRLGGPRRPGGPGGDLARAAAEGWALLSDLDAERPEAVREVLTYPYVQAWAVHCLRSTRSADFELDCAHLAGVAAAAALRAGTETELALPIRDGAVYLPGVGALTVPAGPARTAVLRVSPAGLRCRAGGQGWQTVRRVTAAGMSIAVEDVDPFRDCQVWPAADRLSAATWRTWRQALAAAARQLAAELPAYADVIRVGLRSVVPIRPDPAGSSRSGTARQAFGALALAMPPDADALSVLLLHEMQHGKLAALSDLFDLFDRSDGKLLRVPWRADLRPTEGALHGTYAHLAIAELWRARAQGREDSEARRLFLMYRSWVCEVIETLTNAGTLTPDGERFVSRMQGTVAAWTDVC
jgi:uncharacterized protein